jgi:hypothetical protein
MDPVISQLIQQVAGGDAVTGKAALTLGMLIERETVSRPAGDDGGFSAVLGGAWEGQRLDAAARRSAVAALIKQISGAAPNVTAVWALSKSADPGCVPALAALLDRVRDDPLQSELAAQTLDAVIVLGPGTAQHDAALGAIRRAAGAPHTAVAEHAADWLQRFGGAA